jgi:isopentenyldiphosphate isomerase
MKTLPLGIKHIKSEITEYLTYLTYRVRREIEEAIKEKEDKLILVGGIKHLTNANDDEFSNVKAISLQSELQSIDFGTAFIKCMK